MKPISINAPRPPRLQGFTLVEFLVAFAVGLVALGALLGFTAYTARTLACSMNYVELESQSRRALDTMSQEIRRVEMLTDFASNRLAFKDYDTNTLSYIYSPQTRVLSRDKNGVTNALLTGCDTLAFSIFQRNTPNGSYDQYPTSLQASNCKVIQMTWTCSRAVTGTKLNTETVQTAKIVIRNQ